MKTAGLALPYLIGGIWTPSAAGKSTRNINKRKKWGAHYGTPTTPSESRKWSGSIAKQSGDEIAEGKIPLNKF